MFFRQSRVVCCVFYLLSDLEKFIDCFGFADYEYAYILHDKDKKEDGTLKTAHYHFYGKRKSPITEQSLKNFAKKCEQNIFYENLKSNQNALMRYFLHADNDDKFHYEEKDIVSNFDLSKAKTIDNSIDPAEIITMFDMGFTTIDIVRKYPKLIYSIANLQRYEKLLHISRYRQPIPVENLSFNLVPVNDDCPF